MKKGKYENGAVILENGTILEDGEIDIYDSLAEEINRLVRNLEGLGKKELPDGSTEEVRKRGLIILKNNYESAYKKQVRKIGDLANEYIKAYCLYPVFFEDAAESMLINPQELVAGYIREKSPDMTKAIFTDYSVDEFTSIARDIQVKVTDLAILNWAKHRELNRKAK